MTLSSTELLEDMAPIGETGDLSAAVARAREGDPAAFGAIYGMFSRRVTGLCYHLLGDRDRAKDAAGDVFLRLRDAISTYDGSGAFERWLLRAAANHCIDLLRRRRLERRWVVEQEAADPVSPAASPLTLVLAKEQRASLERAVGRLGAEYRVPLVLRYYGDFTYEEIAEEMGVEKSQVAGRIFRAKQMLRKLLEERVR